MLIASYATLSMTFKAFNMLVSKYQKVIDGNDIILAPTTTKLNKKLQNYDIASCSEVKKLEENLGPRFRSDISSEYDILRRYVVFLSPKQPKNSVQNDLYETHNCSGANLCSHY